jgi:peptidoglycan/xylan/chitin deacetylase (PgdA/CDA1 family)
MRNWLLSLLLLIHWADYTDGKLTRSATSQHSNPLVPSVSSFLAGGQYILLTFSGGPHKFLTPQILDILANYSVHATFFVFGQRALAQNHILQRMVKEGHEIAQQGFHARSIQILNKASSNSIEKSVNLTSAQLYGATGQQIKYFRPPPGSATGLAEQVHASTGLRTLLWSIDISDSIGKMSTGYSSPQSLTDMIVKKAKPGDVILAYDTHPMWTKILPLMLAVLLKEGYEFVTVSQMMSFPDDAPH